MIGDDNIFISFFVIESEVTGSSQAPNADGYLSEKNVIL
jgi:hypothetical protein